MSRTLLPLVAAVASSFLALADANAQASAPAPAAPPASPPAAANAEPAALPERPRPYPLRPDAAWQAACKAGTRSADGTPGPAYWRDDLHYTIAAALDPAAARVTGRAELRLTNRSPAPLPSLVVHLRQNLHREDAVRNTRVAITGGMTVDGLQLDGAPLPGERFEIDGTLLRVRLDHALRTGETATLAMTFAFTVPPAGGAPRMGHEDNRLFFLGYWYPQFAVHDDLQGWVADPYLGCSEFYMPYADYDVAFTAPAGFVVQATGALQNPEEVLAEPVRAALAAAAAAHETVHVVTEAMLENGAATLHPAGGTLTWRFQASDVRDVAIATSDRYLWDAARADVRDQAGAEIGSCLVHALYRPEAKAWRRAAHYARHTIETASRRLTPYPWPHMTACEGVVGGGMEYPMMTAIGDAGVPFVQQMIIAHELIHMWFPMQVGSNETAHAWQDEGLTDFVTDFVCADFWHRRDASSRALAEYTAMSASGGGEEPLMVHGDHYVRPISYGFASYVKPKAMLHQLVGMFGEEQVFAALRGYARAWDRKHPTPWDLFRTMDAALGEDLGWYWRTWCFETWHLDQEIADVRDAGDHVVVTVQDNDDAPHPSRVRATYDDGTFVDETVPVQHWLAGHRTATLEFPAGARTVEVDPDGTTLDRDRSNNVWRR